MSIKHFISPLAVAAASLLLAASCQKTPVDPVPYGKIAFSPEGEEYTKSMLNNTELHTDGNRIKVYDFLTGFEGVINGTTLTSASAPYKYIDDTVEYDSATSTTIWDYTTANALYPWTATGTHKFFGWLSKDNTVSPALASPATFVEATQTVTYPEQTLTASSPQFDFLYSDIVTRDASVATNRATVDLKFKHLFTAVGFLFANESENAITLNEFTVMLPNKNYATIDYSASPVSPALGTLTTGTDFFAKTAIAHTLAAKTGSNPGGKYDPVGDSETTAFRLTWPASAASIAPGPTLYVPPATGREPGVDKNRKYNASDSLIVIKYTPSGLEQQQARVRFPSEDLKAGQKYLFTLKFVNKQVKLFMTLLPWDYTEGSLAYEDDAVTGTSLVLDASTCTIDGTAHSATVTSGKTIKATFKVLTPIGGTLLVGVSGDTGYFNVSPKVITIDPDRDGGLINLSIEPLTSITRDHDCKINLHFYASAHGEEMDANSIINPDNYTFIMLK